MEGDALRLSSPRLGERAFKTVDDLNNLGLHKRMVGEVDVFQIDTADELYAHMNVNYVRLPKLPDFDHYGQMIDAVAHGDDFISTGEILLPSAAITSGNGQLIQAKADVRFTFPLRMAEIVSGDGVQTHHQIFDLRTTPAFAQQQFRWSVTAPGWTWARLAVWDIAGDGAFTNPVWRSPQ